MVDNHAWLFLKVAFATGPTLASLLKISTKLTIKEAVEIIVDLTEKITIMIWKLLRPQRGQMDLKRYLLSDEIRL